MSQFFWNRNYVLMKEFLLHCTLRNVNRFKSRVSEIFIKQMLRNQGFGVWSKTILTIIRNFKCLWSLFWFLPEQKTRDTRNSLTYNPFIKPAKSQSYKLDYFITFYINIHTFFSYSFFRHRKYLSGQRSRRDWVFFERMVLNWQNCKG